MDRFGKLAGGLAAAVAAASCAAPPRVIDVTAPALACAMRGGILLTLSINPKGEVLAYICAVPRKEAERGT